MLSGSYQHQTSTRHPPLTYRDRPLAVLSPVVRLFRSPCPAPYPAVPGRHRKHKPLPPALPAVVLGAAASASMLMTSATAPAPVPVAAAVALPHPVSTPDEQWQTVVPRRPVVEPEPVVAPPAQPTAVTQPTSAPLTSNRPVVKQAVPKREAVVKRAAAPAPAKQEATALTAGKVSCSGSWLSGVKQVAKVGGCDIANRFGVKSIGGYRAGSREHGSGKALDLMCNTATGNAIAEYLLRNKDALGVQHVIWRQRINYGKGWQGMENRGSATANHMDHVHVLFK